MLGRRGLAVLLGGGTLVVSAGVWSVGRFAMTRTFDVAEIPLAVDRAPDPEYGRHLVEHVLACGACHGDDLGGAPMTGGVLVGTLWAPNLTPGRGGIGGTYTAADWVRAIRHGVDREGRGLLFMRTRRWAAMSDSDLADVVAWLGRLPPVDRVPEVDRPGLGLPLVVALGEVVDAGVVRPAGGEPVPWGPTAAYGRYLARLAGCDDCHGPDYGGGRPAWSDVPASPLTVEALAGWTGARFAAAVVRGRAADGRALHPSMPSWAYAGLHDTELDALWLAFRDRTDGDRADGDRDGAVVGEP